MIPPYLMKIKVIENGRKKVGLWLPVFLVWPLMLIFALILTPLLFMASLFLIWRRKFRALLKAIPRFYAVICAARGLDVEVESENENVYITIN